MRLMSCLVIPTLLLAWGSSTAGDGSPCDLPAQLDRLVSLVSDGNAQEIHGARAITRLRLSDGTHLEVALQTLANFNGGDHHVQYLSVFRESPPSGGQAAHCRLLAVAQVGGSGQGLLSAPALVGEAEGRITLRLNALVNESGDLPDLPTGKGDARFQLYVDPQYGGGMGMGIIAPFDYRPPLRRLSP